MMKCSKCGAELNDKIAFCPYCGKEIEKRTVMVEEVSFVDEHKSETKENKISVMWNNLDRQEKFMSIAIIAFALMSLIALVAGKVFSGIVAIISLVLVISAVLLKKQIIKGKEKVRIIVLIMAFVLIVPYLFGLGNYSDAENFDWDILEMSEIVPEPDDCFGEIMSNQNDYCSVFIYEVTEKQFSDYINKCKEKGFSIDAEREDYSFEAFNSQGYKITLYYSDYDEDLHITVEAPEKYDTFEWSEKHLGKLIPTTKSKLGKVEQDNATDFTVYVSEMTIEDFKEYIKQCSDAGFTFEKNESEKLFSAKNKDSYKLSVEYVGNNVIKICVSEPEYTVNFEVHCNQNLMFSQYDVDVYFEDYWEGTVEHGMTEEFTVSAVKGKYDIKFVNTEDEEVTGVVQIEIANNEAFEFEISCTSSVINVEVVKGSEVKTTEKVKETTTKKEKETEIETEEATEKEEPRPVFYSTNDYDTAKKGNTGVFSYKNKSGSYDVYWIIDFDEGYAYTFTEGNGEDVYDKIKITSGTLNDRVTITWDIYGEKTNWYMHFKYVNSPVTLVINDHFGVTTEFTTTDLDDALTIRRTKRMASY